MFYGNFSRRSRAVLTAMVVGISTAGVAFAPSAAAAVHIEQYIEVPQCQPATSQLCPQSPEVRFTAGQKEKLKAQFTANGNHCSDIRVRFTFDRDQSSDWLQVGPGQTVDSPSVYLASGDHVIGVTARGVDGSGCNTGVLSAWGGTVRIDSFDIADSGGPAAEQAPFKFPFTATISARTELCESPDYVCFSWLDKGTVVSVVEGRDNWLGVTGPQVPNGEGWVKGDFVTRN